MVSDPSAQSPLVLTGFFSHRAFPSAQDDDTRGRMVSQAGGIATFLEDGNLVSSAFPSRGMCPEGADRAQAV